MGPRGRSGGVRCFAEGVDTCWAKWQVGGREALVMRPRGKTSVCTRGPAAADRLGRAVDGLVVEDGQNVLVRAVTAAVPSCAVNFRC